MANFFDVIKNKIRQTQLNKLSRQILSMEKQVCPKVIENLPRFSHEEITYLLKEVYPSLESYIQKQLLIVLDNLGYLGQIYEKLNKGSEKEILYALNLLTIFKPIRALDDIFKRLADNRDAIRFEAAYTLISYQSKKVIEMAVKELREDSQCLPARTAQVLVGYGSLAALEITDNLENPKLDQKMLLEVLELMNGQETDGKDTRNILKEAAAALEEA